MEVAVVVGHFVETQVPDAVDVALPVVLLEKLHLNALFGLLVDQTLEIG